LRLRVCLPNFPHRHPGTNQLIETHGERMRARGMPLRTGRKCSDLALRWAKTPTSVPVRGR
jgi:hypothetical protein